MGIIKDEFLREGILLKPGAGVKGPTSVEDLYTFDPPDPIASASIGQVFCAICKDSGERVAVKVQRPDAQITAPVDMFIIRNLASTIKKRFKLRSNLVAIADEFGSQIYSELNYEQEARNCLRFRNLYVKTRSCVIAHRTIKLLSVHDASILLLLAPPFCIHFACTLVMPTDLSIASVLTFIRHFFFESQYQYKYHYHFHCLSSHHIITDMGKYLAYSSQTYVQT